jgi:Spy/CpxP family protein refolding chaperone
MIRTAWVLLLVAVPALSAQKPAPRDTAAMRARHEEFQKRMEARLKQDLNLTDDQVTKLRATREKFMTQRRDLMKRGRDVRDGLRSQLQPGVAANADSVKKLLDLRQQLYGSRAQLARDMDRELATYLNPVQRARIEMLAERMMMRQRGRGGWGRGMRDGRPGGPGGWGGPPGPDGRDRMRGGGPPGGDDDGGGMESTD